MKNNVLKILFWIGAAACTVAACSDDKEEPKPARQEVVLEGEILTLGSDKTAQWKGGEEVGIYMLKAGTTEIVDNYANVKHIAEIRDNKLYFVPADKVPMYFPEDGSEVSIRAYYPYLEGVKTRTSGWVESAMNNHARIHLVEGTLTVSTCPSATKASGSLSPERSTTLTLEPLLSGVGMEILASEQVTSADINMDNVYIGANYNLLTGELIPESLGLLPLNVNVSSQNSSSHSTIKASTLVIPAAINNKANVKITLKDNQDQVVAQGTVSLNEMLETQENGEMKENTQYNVAVQVTENGEIKTQLKGTSPLLILNWTEDQEEEEGTAKPE